MSVGHVYMHPLFPVPKLPSIPPGFDYCLQESPPQAEHEPEQAQASGSNIPLTNRPPEITLTSNFSPQSEAPSSQECDHPPEVALMSHDDGRNDADPGDVPEHADHDYLDDMSDREIFVHEEMYGEI